MSSKLKSGISLVEMLIAMAILSIMGSAVILITVQLMAYSLSTRLKNQSVTYAEEASEQVRAFNQTNGWQALCLKANGGTSCTTGGTTCYPDGNLANPSTCGTPQQIGTTVFSREVKVVYAGSPSLSVAITITVSWMDRGQSKSTVLSSYYYSY